MPLLATISGIHEWLAVGTFLLVFLLVIVWGWGFRGRP